VTGREYVAAYVDFVHDSERVLNAASGATGEPAQDAPSHVHVH
jgi:hypothetical protein